MEPTSALAQPRRGTFAALAYPNFRLWFFGQMFSLFGTWMQTTAQGYLVFQLTRSEAALGYVGFSSGAASLLFILYGGAVADRVPRRRLLIITQCAAMTLALVLAALVFLRVVAAWHIIVLAFCLGVVNAFDAPTRQSFVIEMAGRDVLTNAIALNSTMFNAALVVGPSLGGLVYAWLGPGWCFTINGLSFLAVIGALGAMRLPPGIVRPRTGSTFREIRDGLRAVAGDRRLLGVLGLLAAVNLFGMSFVTLLPAWAVDILRGDARTNGLLLSARGLGALAAALAVASLSPRSSRGRVMVTFAFSLTALLVAFSLTRSLTLSMAVLVGIGACSIATANLGNSLVQSIAPDHLRGRVMGVYMLTFFGFMPLGALLSGTVASAIGVSLAVGLGGIGTAVCAVALVLAIPVLRRLQ